MEQNKTFELVFNKEWQQNSKYVIGYDHYDKNSGSFSVGVVSKPKPEFAVKKIKGFKRIVTLGYSYIVEKLIK